jgi:DNA-binding MarR family transcriptional regulator
MKSQDTELLGNLVDVTFATTARTNSLVAALLEELGLSLALAKALWIMRPDAPPRSMRTLANELTYDPSTMTFVADRLEDKGYLVRRVDPGNRRAKLLELTDAGRQARSRLLQSLAKNLPASHLSLHEQQELYRLLAKGLSLSDAAGATCDDTSTSAVPRTTRNPVRALDVQEVGSRKT